MIATTVMVVIILMWSTITLVVKRRSIDMPDLAAGPFQEVREGDEDGTQTMTRMPTARVPMINKLTGEQEDPLGFLATLS